MQRYFRIASYGLLGAALVIAVATFRLVTDGKRHFQEAMHLTEAGDRAAAVASLEDAAKAYIPGNPYTVRALRELAIMARAAEMRGDIRKATSIWEVTRRSILATRHLFQPNELALVQAEKNLRRLRNEQAPGVRGPDPAARPPDPSPSASLLLFGGLVLWIVGAVWLCLKPRRKNGAPLIPLRFVWAGCLGGLGLWVVVVWLV